MRTGEQGAAYPPEPWRLAGEFLVSAWLVPAEALAFEVPRGFRPLRVGGRLAVGVGWGLYRAPGVLAYHELVAGVLVRRGLAPAVTIPWIWVDSAASRAGGRALWAIPKAMARFAVRETPDATLLEAWQGGELLAECAFARGEATPIRLPGRLTLAQPDGVAARVTPARLSGRLELAGAEWRFGGPLAFLRGREPLASARLREARLLFGRDPR